MDRQEMMGAVEAILYVAGEPVEEEALRLALGVTPLEIQETLDALSSGYDFDRRGIRLLRFGRSVQLSTRPEYAPYIERLLQPVQRQNLSQAAMETLAVIAYRQPATRGDVEAIRGVKCDYSVHSLLQKGLIAEAGKRETLGRPTLFVTTDLFLRHFGIGDLSELPTIDFTAEAVGEDFSMPAAAYENQTALDMADAYAADEGEAGAGGEGPGHSPDGADAQGPMDSAHMLAESQGEFSKARHAMDGHGPDDPTPEA